MEGDGKEGNKGREGLDEGRVGRRKDWCEEGWVKGRIGG